MSHFRASPSRTMLWRFVLLLALPVLVSAEIQSLDMMLYADEYVVHFYDSYIRGPGLIDISSLMFYPKTESMFPEDDEYNDDTDDDGAPKLPSPGQQAADELEGYYIDIVAFQLPRECARTRWGCDWTVLGIGVKMTDTGVKHYCCTQEVIDAELCLPSHYGRLIIDEDFNGDHIFVPIPKEGDKPQRSRSGELREKKTGMYAIAFSNCNELGRQVEVKGSLVWKSRHGYLPGELFGFMYFYMLMTVIYFVAFCWYGVGMHLNAESRIPTDKWILVTLSLGLLEMFFRSGDYFVWNKDGSRQSFIWYVGSMAGVLKQGLSRCLIVMVSLGWGVIRDSLGMKMRTIIVLGTVYVCVSVARDLVVFFAYRYEDIKTLSGAEKATTLFDIATLMNFLIFAVDLVFLIWILVALMNTIQYLENNNQSRKVRRYLQLRTILLVSILFAIVRAIFVLVDMYDEQGIVREEHEWVVDAATEIMYLFVLLCVAYLWRPNPSATENAHVMELLSAIGGEGDGHELELTGTVPSAIDDDEVDEEDEGEKPGKTGYHDQDMRLKIDDAEAA